MVERLLFVMEGFRVSPNLTKVRFVIIFFVIEPVLLMAGAYGQDVTNDGSSNSCLERDGI